MTHHIEEVISIGDDVSILKDGRLVGSFQVTPDLTVDALSARLTERPEPQSPPPRASCKSTSRKPLMSIEGVARPGGGEKSIDLAAGAITAIYGVVGCGREAIAHAVVGLEAPPAGIRMRLHDRRFLPKGPAQAARLGVNYLPSGRAANCLLPTLSVRENLMLRQLGARGGMLPRKADEVRRASHQLARYRTRYRGQEDSIISLSGGNQQKVMLGRCLGARGNLLVLEEPTAGVDVAAKEEIHALLRREADAGLAVMLISSDLDETLALADVVHTMFGGHLIASYNEPSMEEHASIIVDIMGGTATASAREVAHGNA